MKARICPKCGRKYYTYPAISRRDNKTEICSDCGITEALEDWVNNGEAFKGGDDDE